MIDGSGASILAGQLKALLATISCASVLERMGLKDWPQFTGRLAWLLSLLTAT